MQEEEERLRRMEEARRIQEEHLAHQMSVLEYKQQKQMEIEMNMKIRKENRIKKLQDDQSRVREVLSH